MTLADKAYHSIRNDIIRGELSADKPLRMADLSKLYEMGFSPLREALNRLQSERLVIAEALRGFRVAPLSLAELHDATQSRILIETDALRASINNGDDAWEAGIVSALHSLKLQVAKKGKNADIRELEDRHHAFHLSLLAACNSPWRLEFFERLYAACERYRIPILLEAASHTSGRDMQAEHSALADATLARDTDKATALLQKHYMATAEFISSRMQPDERRDDTQNNRGTAGGR